MQNSELLNGRSTFQVFFCPLFLNNRKQKVHKWTSSYAGGSQSHYQYNKKNIIRPRGSLCNSTAQASCLGFPDHLTHRPNACAQNSVPLSVWILSCIYLLLHPSQACASVYPVFSSMVQMCTSLCSLHTLTPSGGAVTSNSGSNINAAHSASLVCLFSPKSGQDCHFRL